MSRAFSILIVFLTLAGCATQKKGSELPNKVSPSRENYSKRAENKIIPLKQMVEIAKQKGPKAVQFLATDLFLKGNDASMRGDNKMAAFVFEHLYSLKPEDNFIKRKYAIELIKLGKVEKSLVLFEELFKSESDDPRIGLILGGIYVALEQKEKARGIYKKVIKDFPHFSEACIFLAKSYAKDEEYKNSFKYLNRCEKGDTKNAIYSFYKGKITYERGNIKRATNYFNKSLSIDPSYYQAALALGMIYEEKGNFKSAINVYKDFLENNPGSFAILSRVVKLLFAEERFQEVIPYAESLVSLDPSDLNLKVRLGILYTDAKKYTDAIGVFSEILKEIPDSDKILFYIGSLYQQIEDYEQAIKYFSKINPKSNLYLDGNIQISQILGVLAYDAFIKGDESKTEEFVAFVDDNSSNFPDSQFDFRIHLVEFYEKIKRFNLAIELIEDEKESKELSENMNYYLASLYEKNNQYKESRVIIRKILDKNPKNAQAWNFLGYSLIESGENLDLAYDYINKAIKLRPTDGYIRDSLGWYYYKTGNLQKALKEIKTARKLIQDSDANLDMVISKHLAIIYKDLKKYDEAKKFYNEALRNCTAQEEKNLLMNEIDALEKLRLPASK